MFNKNGIRTPGLLLDDAQRINLQTPDPEIGVFEIGAQRDTRDSSDILPFIPPFRDFLTPLRPVKKQVGRALKVPLSEIECLTDMTTRGIIPEIWQGGDTYKAAREVLRMLCKAWTDEVWNEIDLSKVTNLSLVELREKRWKAVAVIATSQATRCKHFVKHVSYSRHTLSYRKRADKR